MHSYTKKLFKHGGSMAVSLPSEAVKKLRAEKVSIEIRNDGIFIPFELSHDTLETDPLFQTFVEAICKNALENPDQLLDSSKVWDSEWDNLLDGVDGGKED